MTSLCRGLEQLNQAVPIHEAVAGQGNEEVFTSVAQNSEPKRTGPQILLMAAAEANFIVVMTRANGSAFTFELAKPRNAICPTNVPTCSNEVLDLGQRAE